MNKKKLFSLRETLHRNPETAFNEFKTQEILLNFISETIEGKSGFVLKKPFKTSVVIEYRGAVNAPFFLFRADMDALSIREPECNPVVSTNGNMHACGHDIHMTVLCGLLAHVAETLPEKNILFLFQPGEEGAGGAKMMLEQGIFDQYDISRAFALHVTDDYMLGEVASNSSVLFAMPREVDITFEGKSSHAAFPQRGNDAISMAAHFLATVNLAIAKGTDPMKPYLFHTGKIEGGDARNIAASCCNLYGTMRALDVETMETGCEIVRRHVESSAELFGGKGELKILGEFIPVKNSPDLYSTFNKCAESTGLRTVEAPTKLVGEDFGFFSQRYPSLMFWLGTRKEDEEGISLHNPKYYPGDSVISLGVEMMASLLSECW